MFSLPKDLLIFDVETSGTDPNTASIIQLGACVFNKKGYLEKGLEGGETRHLIQPRVSFNEYIKPYTNEWTEGAYKIHRIEKSFLENTGKDLDTVLHMFEVWASCIWADLKKRYWLAQWSCGFDTNFLRAAYRKVNREYPFHYRAFDVASIVRFELARRGKLFRKCGEEKCARALGIEVFDTQLHDALYDATLSGLMLEKIVKGE